MGMGDVRGFVEAFEEQDTVLTDDAVMEAQETQDDRDALTIIKDTLASYGLEGLAADAYRYLMEGSSTDSVMIQLKDSDIYRDRFAGMDTRRQQGLPAISPAEYIRLERDYRQTMSAAGLPEGFYDSPDDFADFIGNDVSPAEMTQRVSMATTAVSNVNPELKNQLREMYGIGVENDGELISYFLRPRTRRKRNRTTLTNGIRWLISSSNTSYRTGNRHRCGSTTSRAERATT